MWYGLGSMIERDGDYAEFTRMMSQTHRDIHALPSPTPVVELRRQPGLGPTPSDIVEVPLSEAGPPDYLAHVAAIELKLRDQIDTTTRLYEEMEKSTYCEAAMKASLEQRIQDLEAELYQAKSTGENSGTWSSKPLGKSTLSRRFYFEPTNLPLYKSESKSTLFNAPIDTRSHAYASSSVPGQTGLEELIDKVAGHQQWRSKKEAAMDGDPEVKSNVQISDEHTIMSRSAARRGNRVKNADDGNYYHSVTRKT